jgi:hypothetical protein
MRKQIVHVLNTMTFTFDKRTVDWPFYADAQGVPHRHLISACNAGLCNRLLVAAGCLRLAKKLNRKFVLWWVARSTSCS